MSGDSVTRGSTETFGSARLHDGGFAYGSRVSAGALIYTAGLSPLDDAGEIVGPDDPVTQVRRAVECLDVVLREQNARRADIAKLTVYVATADRATLGAVWQEVDAAFGGTTPPAIVVGVTVLPYPGQMVEIEAVVATGESA